MKRWLRNGALGLCGAGQVLGGTSAWAQPVAAPYVDRVLDDSPQAAPVDEPQVQGSGWPRGWTVEAQSTRQSGATRTQSNSLLFSGCLLYTSDAADE